MRIGKVIGRVCLSRSYKTLAGGRFLLVEVQDRFSLAGEPRKSKESLVVYDHLGAHTVRTLAKLPAAAGARWIGLFSLGREPSTFWPGLTTARIAHRRAEARKRSIARTGLQ